MYKPIIFVATLLFFSCSNNTESDKIERLRDLRFELANVESELSEIRYGGMDALRLYESVAHQLESEKTMDEIELQNSAESEVFRFEREEHLLLDKRDSINSLIDKILGEK